MYTCSNTEFLVDADSHQQLFPQSPDEFSELPNFCKCFKLSASGQVKEASSVDFDDGR